MSFRFTSFILLVAGLFPANIHAQELWIATRDAKIGIIDVATGNTIVSKTITGQGVGWRGIAFSPDRELYASTGTDLFRIDFEAGTSQLIGRFGPILGTYGDLTFDMQGTLYSGRGFVNSDVHVVDTQTGEATQLFDHEIGIHGAQGMAFVGGDLYQAVVIDNMSTGNRVLRHDLSTTPIQTQIIDNPVLAGVSGLGSPDGQVLYGIDGGTTIVRIDKDTGATTAVSDFDGGVFGEFRQAAGFAFVNESSTVTVAAEGQKLLDGLVSGGQTADLLLSDNQYLELDPAPTTNFVKQKIDAVLQTTSPVEIPQQFKVLVEARMLGGPVGDVIQQVRCFNYQSNSWEVIDARPAENAESQVVLETAGQAERFVQPVTREMTISITWKSDSFSGSPFLWSIDVDQAVWLIVP